jgi:regulator of replication initiation timing
MLERMWYYIFNKKEEINMPEVTKKSVDVMKTDLNAQTKKLEVCNKQISNLQTRVSTLIDENRLLETQLTKLRETVAEDIKYLYEKIS